MVERSTPAIEIPSNEHLALRVMPMPADLNPAGDVFGGWIMAMVDIAGAVPALRRARSRVVTVAVNSFVFKQPVSVGDVVSFYADVASVGSSSMTVDVHVFAERHPANPVVVKVTEARLTYVAVDEQGRKRPVGEGDAAGGLAACAEPPSDKELVLRVVPMPAVMAAPRPLAASSGVTCRAKLWGKTSTQRRPQSGSASRMVPSFADSSTARRRQASSPAEAPP